MVNKAESEEKTMNPNPHKPYDEADLMRDAENDIVLSEEYGRRADLSERLRSITMGLSENQRQIITLYYFGGLNLPEITEVMDCGENTAKTRLSLARGSVTTEIKELERKSPESFKDKPFLPFRTIYLKQLKKAALAKEQAAHIYKMIRKQTTDRIDKENHHGNE